MDTSSELIHALLPLYMVGALGASVFVVGVIEGFAEALALMIRVFSGYWSDALRKRKPLVVAGYALSAVSKLAFPLASTLGVVVAARFADRVGKGIRGAPRDALIADLAPATLRGATFGLRQALDTVGALLGPLVAVVAIGYFAGDFHKAFWLAIDSRCVVRRPADRRRSRSPARLRLARRNGCRGAMRGGSIDGSSS